MRTIVGDAFLYELMVVDNGSTDGTPTLAEAEGARVVTSTGRTIAAVRNDGAKLSAADLLVFLDADVTLTRSWLGYFQEAIAAIRARPQTLAGSNCAIPSESSWIERYWFAPQVDSSLSHIGSAHLIVDRDFFLQLGGFDERLETGEDYDFSVRAFRAGGTMHRMPASVVEHHGYPKTLRRFFQREIWHGRGDATSVAAVATSKVAMAALLFVALHLAALAALLAGYPVACFVFLGLILLLCTASAVHRYGVRSPRLLLVNVPLYYVYYVARAASFGAAISRPARRSEATA